MRSSSSCGSPLFIDSARTYFGEALKAGYFEPQTILSGMLQLRDRRECISNYSRASVLVAGLVPSRRLQHTTAKMHYLDPFFSGKPASDPLYLNSYTPPPLRTRAAEVGLHLDTPRSLYDFNFAGRQVLAMWSSDVLLMPWIVSSLEGTNYGLDADRFLAV